MECVLDIAEDVFSNIIIKYSLVAHKYRASKVIVESLNENTLDRQRNTNEENTAQPGTTKATSHYAATINKVSCSNFLSQTYSTGASPKARHNSTCVSSDGASG